MDPRGQGFWYEQNVLDRGTFDTEQGGCTRLRSNKKYASPEGGDHKL